MGEVEEQKGESRLTSLTNALRRRQEDRLEVNDYQIGDIRAEKTVVVKEGAMLVGDLLAPEIVVTGVVYGYVACRHLTVAPKGQIWGDVYVNTLELAPSGKINGWLCTLDAGTVDLLRAKELGKGDLPDQDDRQLPKELLERVQRSGADVEADQHESQRRSGIWRQLRSEAALALIARYEIEATIDGRVAEALARSSGAEAAVEDVSFVDQGEQAETLSGGADETAEGTEDVERLRLQLRQATSAAQKYYGELLWTRAELRAAKRGERAEE